MGERLLAHALAAEGTPLSNIKVRSAGVSAFPGDAAAPNSIRVLKKVGIPLEDHRSSLLSPEMVDNALAIFTMTEGHREYIRAVHGDSSTPILLFRELIGKGADTQVSDPIGGSLRDYEDTRDTLAEAVPSILDFLRKRLSERQSGD